MNAAWRAAGAVVAAAVLLAMTWASTAPLSIAPSAQAVLRVSLGARPERIERCRTVTDEELAKIAPQMRQQVICEGTTARYTLEVRRNDTLLHAQVVRGGGLRHDRQLYVSRDIRVPAGPGTYRVELVRLDSTSSRDAARDTAGRPRDQRDDQEHDDDRDDAARASGEPESRAAREAAERRRRREEAIPPTLRLDVEATLAPREVLLVSYDAGRRRLVSRRGVSGDR